MEEDHPDPIPEIDPSGTFALEDAAMLAIAINVSLSSIVAGLVAVVMDDALDQKLKALNGLQELVKQIRFHAEQVDKLKATLEKMKAARG